MLSAMIQSMIPGFDMETVMAQAQQFAGVVVEMNDRIKRVEEKQDLILALLQQSATAVDAKQGQDGTLQDATKDDNGHYNLSGNASPGGA